MTSSRLFFALMMMSAAACDSGGGDDTGADAAIDAPPATQSDAATDASATPDGGPPTMNVMPQYLSEWHLFTGDGSTQEPVDGVVPYSVISQLFADYAAKRRFMYIPTGEHITYSDTDRWELPVGSVFVKTFSYPHDMRDLNAGERLLETRLLIHTEVGWEPITYVWNEEQTEATRTTLGTRIDTTWIDHEGETQTLNYRVPNTNQCKNCHGGTEQSAPLAGSRTRQMDHDFDYGAGAQNQIDYIASLGWFDRTPTAHASRTRLVSPLDTTASLDARARSYLEANCAHCHRNGGAATSSGLWLMSDITNIEQIGVCKRPPAAGRGTCGLNYDIVPGHADMSIMTCRINSNDPEIKMPELPLQMIDPTAVSLLTDWINALPSATCTP